MPPLKTSDLSADVHADCTAIHHDDATRSLPLSVRIANFLTIVLPFVGLAAAIFFFGAGDSVGCTSACCSEVMPSPASA